MDETLGGLAVLSRKTEQLAKVAGGKRWCALITSLSIVALILFLMVIWL